MARLNDFLLLPLATTPPNSAARTPSPCLSVPPRARPRRTSARAARRISAVSNRLVPTGDPSVGTLPCARGCPAVRDARKFGPRPQIISVARLAGGEGGVACAARGTPRARGNYRAARRPAGLLRRRWASSVARRGRAAPEARASSTIIVVDEALASGGSELLPELSGRVFSPRVDRCGVGRAWEGVGFCPETRPRLLDAAAAVA